MPLQCKLWSVPLFVGFWSCLVIFTVLSTVKIGWEVHMHNQGRGKTRGSAVVNMMVRLQELPTYLPCSAASYVFKILSIIEGREFDRSLILSTAGEDLDLNGASCKGGNWGETFVSPLMINVHNNSCWNLLYVKINDFWNWIEECLSRACFSLLSPK